MTADHPTRRRYLKALGGVTALATLAGCPGSDPDQTETPTGTAEETETARETDEAEELPNVNTARDDVVDVVEAGASPNGDEPVVPILEDVVADGKTLFFPSGEYRLTQEWRVKEFSDLSIVGEDATFRVEEGFDDYLFALGNPDGATGLTVAGLEFDISAPNTGARPLHGMVEDSLWVKDVRVTGTQDVDQDSVRFDVTDPGGTGVVTGLELPDGGDANYAITGCYVGEVHTGTLRFVDCHIAGFPDNGLYASPATGTVIVEGGLYENNDISNVRVSGPSEVRGVHVRCDTSPERYSNMRGIRLREGSDVLVEDCTVEMQAVTGSDGGITVSNWLEAATIRDTEIVVDADDVPAILAKSPDDQAVDSGDSHLNIENVTVSGSAEGTAAVRLLERENCLVDDVCIVQTGAARDGVDCTRVTESTLRNSSIAVTGDPIVLTDTELTREQLQTQTIGANASIDGSPCK